jgi:hypothetical protein
MAILILPWQRTGPRRANSLFIEADYYSRVSGLYLERPRDALMVCFAFTKMGALDTAT